jgi:hypothetical protein
MPIQSASEWRVLLVAVAVVCCVLSPRAASADEPPPCPDQSERIQTTWTLTGVNIANNVSVPKPLSLCHTLSAEVEFTHPDNPQFMTASLQFVAETSGTFTILPEYTKLGTATQGYFHDYLPGSGAGMSGPAAATRGSQGRVSYLRITATASVAPSSPMVAKIIWNYSIRPDAGMNRGGDTLGNGPVLTSTNAAGSQTYQGSIHPFEPVGQTWRVTLQQSQGFFITGKVVTRGNAIGYTPKIYNTSGQWIDWGYNWSAQGEVAFSTAGQVFFNPDFAPKTVVLQIKPNGIIQHFELNFWFVPQVQNSQLTLRGGLGGDPLLGAVGVNFPAVAKVPLGQTATFEVVNSQGAAVPATFAFVGAHHLSPGVRPDSLFPAHAAFRYVPNPATPNRITVQSVHLGGATVRVTPTSGAASRDFVLLIEAPVALGLSCSPQDQRPCPPGGSLLEETAADRTLRQLLVPLAHSSGLPPDLLRAQVFQEGGTNPLSYRYEPYGPGVGDFTAISRGQNFRFQTDPHHKLRFATEPDELNTPGLTQGIDVSSVDLEVPAQSGLEINCPRDQAGRRTGPGVAITATDQFISAQEVEACNVGVENWDDVAPAARIVAFRRTQFTAQMSLAASYGLFQVTPVRAYEQGWKTVDGRRNPTLLFDTPENHAVGGGSLGVARRALLRPYPASMSTAPDVVWADRGQFVDSFRVSLGGYNASPTYATRVLRWIPYLWPVAARPLF